MKKGRHKNVPASYLVLCKDNKVLLSRRYNTGYEDGMYSLVAGHVDPKETFTQCIIREAQEEAGIVLRAEDVTVAHIMHRNCSPDEEYERIDTFFVAEKWEGEIVNREPHKCDELSWFDLDSLPENLLPYVKQAIEGAKNKIYYSEYGWE
jgi:ADP-ribose pyrophosphatase YjhB (NUDIX family)